MAIHIWPEQTPYGGLFVIRADWIRMGGLWGNVMMIITVISGVIGIFGSAVMTLIS